MAEMGINANEFAGVAQGGKAGGDATGTGSAMSGALGMAGSGYAAGTGLNAGTALGDGGLAIAGSAGLGGGDVTDNTSIGSININS